MFNRNVPRYKRVPTAYRKTSRSRIGRTLARLPPVCVGERRLTCGPFWQPARCQFPGKVDDSQKILTNFETIVTLLFSFIIKSLSSDNINVLIFLAAEFRFSRGCAVHVRFRRVGSLLDLRVRGTLSLYVLTPPRAKVNGGQNQTQSICAQCGLALPCSLA